MNIISGNSYLIDHYRKKSDLFIAYLYKANITLNEDDIHNVRVEVKKIRSFFKLLKTIDKNKEELQFIKNSGLIFKKIFEYTGQLREAQLNLSETDKLNINRSELNQYKKFLRDSVKKSVSGFRSEMKIFDIDHFLEIKKGIEKICIKNADENISDKCIKFIRKEIGKIDQILNSPPENEKLHMIRKYLKNIHSTSVHLSKIEKIPGLSRFIKETKKSEVLLGDWHDKIVFSNSIQNFLNSNDAETENKFPQLSNLLEISKLNNEVSLTLLYKNLKKFIGNADI